MKQSRPAERDGGDTLFLAAIVLTAFALRLVYVLQLRSSPTFAHPLMDELYHDQWARAIASGEVFVEGPYFRAPLYPAFLGVIYKLFGPDYFIPRLIQAGLGSLSCGLLYVVGRLSFGRTVGAVAGFAAASYWMLIYFDGELLIPTLVVFLDLLLILALIVAVHNPGISVFAAVGVILGLSAIARPNILLFAPAVAVWAVILHRPRPRRALIYVACMAGGSLAVILPITVRNGVVGEDLALIATQGGVNFYIGNNPQADGRTAIVPGTPGGWWEGYHAAIARAETALGRELKPSEVSRYYFREAVRFIGGQPGEFLALMLLKLRLFWTHWEISNNKGIYFWTAHFTPVVRWLPLGFGVVGPLGIVGLALCWRRRLELFPVWGFVLVYMVSVLLFFCTARYRMPVVPPLILLAVFAGSHIVHEVRHGRWRSVGLAVLALIPAALLVHVTPETKQFRNDAFSYCRLGSIYAQTGDFARAAENYRQAIRIAPYYLSAHFELGKLLYKSQREDEAIVEFRRALGAPAMRLTGEPDSTVARVHSLLAKALWERGEPLEAAEHYRAAIDLAPELNPGASHFYVALTLEEGGLIEESAAAFAEALDPLRNRLREEPDDPTLLYMLGRALAARGLHGEAISILRRCLSFEPTNLPALDALSKTLIDVAHYDEAIQLLRRANPLRQRWITNRLAFLLATCPHNELRNGAEALEYAHQLCPEIAACGPLDLDVFAAALAEKGRYRDAANLARNALAQLAQSDRPEDKTLIHHVAERLRSYEAGRPWRLPQP